MTILVTGAGGKTGRAILAALVRENISVRAFSRRPVEGIAGVETAVGDLRNQSDVTLAMQAVSKVYHISPNMHPDEVGIGQLVIDQAKAAGVDHFVYHSVLHPQIEAMPHHWRKLRVEELLFRSGLPYTILQPTAYMQNIQVEQVCQDGVYAVPYSVSAQLALVDLVDVAAVAAKVLLDQGHVGAIYELVGERPLSQIDVAQLLSKYCQKPITAVEIPLDEWAHHATINGISQQKQNDLIAMFQYYAKFGLIGNNNLLTWLLGKQPTSLLAFLNRLSK